MIYCLHFFLFRTFSRSFSLFWLNHIKPGRHWLFIELIVFWTSTGLYRSCIATIVVSDHGRRTQIPTFVQEPPSHVVFSNNTGASITCSAHGSPVPSITWLTKDGSLVNSVPGLRYDIIIINFFSQGNFFWHDAFMCGSFLMWLNMLTFLDFSTDRSKSNFFLCVCV